MNADTEIYLNFYGNFYQKYDKNLVLFKFIKSILSINWGVFLMGNYLTETKRSDPDDES